MRISKIVVTHINNVRFYSIAPMKVKIASALLLLVIVTAHAQVEDADTAVAPKSKILSHLVYNFASVGLSSVFNDPIREGANNRVTVDFDYLSNSNAAPASFVYAMLFKGPISNPLKDRITNRLSKYLHFEDNMKTGVTYQRYFQKWGGSAFIGLHHRQTRAIRAHKQTFETIFYGNARFEDDTANFSNFYFQNYIYNQLSVGIKKEIDYGKYQMEFGVSGSFLQCINNQDISTRNTSIYTAPDGEFLNIVYDVRFNTAREGATNFGQMNGAGASADFHLAFKNRDKWRIAFDMTDVGYLTFRKTPVNYNGANQIQFKGIVLPELINFSSLTFDTLNIEDTLRSKLPSRSTSKYSVFMPFSAQLVFSKPIGKFVIHAGLLHRYMPGYYVYGFAKMNYFIKPDMQITASVGAGGFSLFNLGFDFTKSWKYFDLTVGSSNLGGLLLPPYLPGGSVYLRLASSF